jgi:hypothetical protein
MLFMNYNCFLQDEYESWDSVNIKEEVKDDVLTSDCDQYLEKWVSLLEVNRDEYSVV